MRKLLGSLVLLFASSLAGAQTLAPTADAYVLDGAWANSNFGTATGLFTETRNGTSNNYDSYLKFDTASIGGPGSVASAKLRVSASLSSGSIGMNAYPVSDTSWSETTITWNNKPARGSSLGSKTVSGSAYTVYEYDVTAYVIAEKAAGRNVVSFALHNPSTSTQAIWIQSRESGAGGPQLVITPNAAPTVSLTAPASGAVFLPGANVTVTASAADSDGTIAKVEFFDGATLAATVTAAPYTASLTGLAAGTHSLTAKATDNLGLATPSAVVSIRVDAAPTVSISSPASGAVFNAPATVSLTATAADTDGTIAKVDFYQGATLVGTATASPYTASVSGLASGGYSFTAVATDNDGGQTTSAAVSVTVDAPPTVAITSPAAGATFNAPATVPITVGASDPDGTISRVELYANNTLIAALTTAPYSFIWTNVGAGTYALQAKAVDNNNAETMSDPVNVTVQSAVAALYFIEVDHLNTPRAIYDANQNLKWRWEQAEPFGVNAPDENPGGLGSFKFALRFGGWQYADDETGEFWNWFRTYSSTLGRFDQSDQIGLAGGLNTYAYVRANPLLLLDPMGLVADSCKPQPTTIDPVIQLAGLDSDYCRKRREYCITFCSYNLGLPGRFDNFGPFRACMRRCMNDAGCDL